MWLKVLKSTSRIFITQKVDRVMRVFKTSYMQNCVILDEMWLKVLKVPAVFLSCKERIESCVCLKIPTSRIESILTTCV